MVKKMYKKGKKMLKKMSAMGMMPQPIDFMQRQDQEYSYFEFPEFEGVVDIPVLNPGPGDMSIKDYAKVFKTVNKFKDKEKKGKGKF